MGRGRWLAVLALGLLGLGVAVRLQRPSAAPALPCPPERVRVDAAGVAACEAPGAPRGELQAPPAAALLALGGKLDLNRATEEELGAVPGVGPSLARALVQARTQAGGFRGWDAVDAVPGVGPAKLSLLQAHTEIR